eukprot:INCI5808.1.p1 GENE.INCI5808.1~~INCI5808.1.p1  ORF type:complete len:246 (+),score=58.08 INCI5808.1:84-821(+)
MSNYNALDGDDTYTVIADGIEAVTKCTKRMNARLGALRRRDTALLRKQIEDEHRRGQDYIAEVKAELRGASHTDRIAQAEREFRNECNTFKETFQEYKRVVAGQTPTIGEDEAGGDETLPAGGGGSQQSLTMLMEADDVDAIMAQENQEDARRLAQDTAAIRETMVDIHGLIEEGGEDLMTIDQEVEGAAEAAESATQELTKAREHQKSNIKLKLAIGICCGVTLLTGLFILLWRLGVFDKKSVE